LSSAEGLHVLEELGSKGEHLRLLFAHRTQLDVSFAVPNDGAVFELLDLLMDGRLKSLEPCRLFADLFSYIYSVVVDLGGLRLVLALESLQLLEAELEGSLSFRSLDLWLDLRVVDLQLPELIFLVHLFPHQALVFMIELEHVLVQVLVSFEIGGGRAVFDQCIAQIVICWTLNVAFHAQELLALLPDGSQVEGVLLGEEVPRAIVEVLKRLRVGRERTRALRLRALDLVVAGVSREHVSQLRDPLRSVEHERLLRREIII